MIWVAGVDGCPAGWLAVFRSAAEHRAQIYQKISEILDAPERPTIVAVDIPIGLQPNSKKGGRRADIEARQVLKYRKSSIFPAPSRPALKATSFEEAKEIEKANSTPPKKLARQAYNLFCKIRELDAIAADHLGVIFECHPEVSFWAMNNKTDMSLSKRKRAGFEDRCQLLARNGFDSRFLETRLGFWDEHSLNDLADACVAAWTAERILRKEAVRFPATPEIDETGLDMAIWA